MKSKRIRKLLYNLRERDKVINSDDKVLCKRIDSGQWEIRIEFCSPKSDERVHECFVDNVFEQFRPDEIKDIYVTNYVFICKLQI